MKTVLPLLLICFLALTCSPVAQAESEANLSSAFIKCAPEACVSVGSHGKHLRLFSGQLMVAARQPLTIVTRNATLHLRPGTIAHLDQGANALRIDNLSDTTSNALEVIVNGQSLHLRLGQEFLVADSQQHLQAFAESDPVNRRRPMIYKFPGSQLVILSCEFNPLSVMKTSRAMKGIYTSSHPAKQEIYEQLCKSCASLSVATAGHGSYMLVAKSQ